MRAWPGRGAAALLTVTGVLALASLPGSGTAVRDHPAPEASRRQRPVTSTTLVCPGRPVGLDGRPARRVSTSVSLGLAPPSVLAAGQGSEGSDGSDGPTSRVRVRSGNEVTTPAAPPRGRLTPVARGAADLRLDGSAAAGAFAGRVDRVGGGAGGALAVASCSAPRASWWFTGAGADLDHASTLTLANPGDGPAEVDVRVLGGSGEVETPGATGLTVRPGETTTLSLLELAPQQREIALHVVASRGLVVASVSDALTAGAGSPVGSEWLPSSGSPRRTVLLAGLQSNGSGPRRLVVANPGGRQALVRLAASSPTGRFVPSGFPEITVAPGSVTSVDVGALPFDRVGALALRSNVPVTGVVRTAEAGDLSYAAPLTALPGPAAWATVARAGQVLSLTGGPSMPAVAQLETYGADGRAGRPRRFRLAPGATVRTDVPSTTRLLLLRPLSGSVIGAVAVRGAGISAVGLAPLPITRTLPVVRPGLGQSPS